MASSGASGGGGLECTVCGVGFGRNHEYKVHMKGTGHAGRVAELAEQAAERDRRAAQVKQSKAYKAAMAGAVADYTRRLHRGLVSVPRAEPEPQQGVDAQVLALYARTRPRKHVLRMRKALLGLANDAVQLFFPDARLEVYGSIPLGLDSEASDIDVSIISDVDEVVLLGTLADALDAAGIESLTVSRTLTARIPLITLADSLSGLELDLSIWKLDKLEINKVFTTYLAMDARVPPFLFAIRAWAKARNINDAYTGTINSFGLTVLGIAFLQVSGVLPIMEELPGVEDELAAAGAAGPIVSAGPIVTASTSGLQTALDARDVAAAGAASVGDLVTEFFDWLVAFDHVNDRISIRHGGVTPKEAHKFDDDTVFVIERPRTPYQNVTRQVTDATMRRLTFEFRRAHHILHSSTPSFDALLDGEDYV